MAILASFSILIPPKPAPRPRVTRWGTYNDPKYTEYKKLIGYAARQMKFYTEDAIGLDIEFIFKYPNSWSKKKKSEIVHHTSTPDIDNLIKSIQDGMNGICIKDDGQVCSVTARKRYGGEDKVIVRIVSASCFTE